MQNVKLWLRIILAVVVGCIFFTQGIFWLLESFAATQEFGCQEMDCLTLGDTWWELILAFLVILLGLAFLKGAWDKWRIEADFVEEESPQGK